MKQPFKRSLKKDSVKKFCTKQSFSKQDTIKQLSKKQSKKVSIVFKENTILDQKEVPKMLDQIEPMINEQISESVQQNSSKSSKSKISSISGRKKKKKNQIKSKIKLRRTKKSPKFIQQSDLKDEKKKCRICFSSKCSKKTGNLIIPCNCRGIFATVHQKCISDWIVSMCSDTCDICRFKFSIKAQNKGLIDFIIEERQFHFICRTLTIILFSLYLILIVAAFIQVCEKYSFINSFYTILYKTSCSLLIFILLCYVGFYFIERFLTFRKWKKYKYHITVKPNPNYKINEITTPPPDIMRTSGLIDYLI